MKTHEFAKALDLLSRLLKRNKSIELQYLELSDRLGAEVSGASIPIALSTLVALSKFDKTQWLEVIRLYEFPVEIRPRDASRDILGKILKHLEESPDARLKLASQANRSIGKTSPELLSALQLLLKK